MKKHDLLSLDPKNCFQCKSKDDAILQTTILQKKMYNLLYKMYAHNKYSLLIILQGIDASGKDGAIRHIFSSSNPQGIKVYSFKKPTPEEAQHDFLWRCHKKIPGSGLATIFNRSYYEEVTTVKVHPELLLQQNIPEEIIRDPEFFSHRYECINDFEKLLAQRGTLVLKFFLHISKDEQKKRIQDRLKNRSKNWKFSIDDIKERKFWNKYMVVFNEMLHKTHTKNAPWIIIPSDFKWYRDFILSKSIVDQLETLNMKFPKSKFKSIDIT